jgi:hypothetical protein
VEAALLSHPPRPHGTLRRYGDQRAGGGQGAHRHPGVDSSGRVGRDREWQLEGQQLAAVRAYLDRISAQWDARIERLRAFVEGKD